MHPADNSPVVPMDPDRFMRDLDAVVAAAAGRAYMTILRFHASAGASGDAPALSQRVFSTVPNVYPVGQRKALDRTPWLEQVYDRFEPFLADGPEALARTFSDYEIVLGLGAVRLANFPIVRQGNCIGLINVAQSAGHDAARLMVIGPRVAALSEPVAATLLNHGWFPDHDLSATA